MDDCPIPFTIKCLWSRRAIATSAIWDNVGATVHVYITFDKDMDTSVVPEVGSFEIQTDDGDFEPDSIHWDDNRTLHLQDIQFGNNPGTVNVLLKNFDSGLRDVNIFEPAPFNLLCSQIEYIPTSITHVIAGNEIEHTMNFDRNMEVHDSITTSDFLLHLNGGNVEPDNVETFILTAVSDYDGAETPGTGAHLVDYDGTNSDFETVEHVKVSAFSILSQTP